MHRRSAARRRLTLVGLLCTALAVPAAGAAASGPALGAGASGSPLLRGLVDADRDRTAVVAGDRLRVTPGPAAVAASVAPAAALAASSPGGVDALVTYAPDGFAADKRDVLAAAPGDARLVRDYPHLPVHLVHLDDAAALAAVAASGGVRSVQLPRAYERQLDRSLPLVAQPVAHAAGATGAGTSVAVLDTGVDYRRSAFGSCSAPGGACAVADARDFAPEDGLLDAPDGHGTNVAGGGIPSSGRRARGTTPPPAGRRAGRRVRRSAGETRARRPRER
ncbi:S8/S53 family peptidase [Motilibacter aurantiacus]|uniref:hypothetical protein n=1 Tax=Motilibacter aurantiacus TaxID=2714955 RepID=UPI001407C3AC|nr:hypothetical protein [Motilibacter aurantiacus]NHC47281.1 hypothetical protein [Motilibacter aurantiacus]